MIVFPLHIVLTMLIQSTPIELTGNKTQDKATTASHLEEHRVPIIYERVHLIFLL